MITFSWELMNQKMIKETYEEAENVKEDEKMTTQFWTRKGMRQGYVSEIEEVLKNKKKVTPIYVS